VDTKTPPLSVPSHSLRLLQLGSFTFPFLQLDPSRIRRCLMTTKASPTLHYCYFKRSHLAVCCGVPRGRQAGPGLCIWPAGKPHTFSCSPFYPSVSRLWYLWRRAPRPTMHEHQNADVDASSLGTFRNLFGVVNRAL
jgi:hypothetical protein